MQLIRRYQKPAWLWVRGLVNGFVWETICFPLLRVSHKGHKYTLWQYAPWSKVGLYTRSMGKVIPHWWELIHPSLWLPNCGGMTIHHIHPQSSTYYVCITAHMITETAPSAPKDVVSIDFDSWFQWFPTEKDSYLFVYTSHVSATKCRKWYCISHSNIRHGKWLCQVHPAKFENMNRNATCLDPIFL